MTPAQRKEVLRRSTMSLPKMDARALLDRFAHLPEVEAARTIMVYAGVGREPDTWPLVQLLLSRGQRVALPSCLPGRQMEARLITGRDHVEVNHYGIPEPDYSCPVVPKSEIDVVLVPGMLCDREGYRLGYGGGYYDRWLAGYEGLSVIVCPRDHLVDAMPREEYDVPVKLVLTDED